jgi:HPt (histidine-containing phosphotransfer) domain-containing protein
VLRSFTVNIPPHIEKLKHVTRSHLADYAITVHGIKGSCRAINAAAVGDKAEALEKAAKANNFAFICTYNAGFIEAVEKLIADLSDMLSMLDADIAKPQKSRPDTEILDQLLKACKKYDMDAVDALIQDMGRYEYTQDGGLASWLRDNAEDSNFAQMIQRLSDLGK